MFVHLRCRLKKNSILFVGVTYRHYKGESLYLVRGLVRNKTNETDMVLYESVEDHKLYVRTKEEFLGIVPDTNVYRFEPFVTEIK